MVALHITEDGRGELVIAGDFVPVTEFGHLPDGPGGARLLYYVYALTEQSGEVRYVGCTSDPRQRLTTHRCGHGGRGTCDWSFDVRERGERIEMVILERHAQEDVAYLHEQLLIERFSTRLVNSVTFRRRYSKTLKAG